MYSPRHFEETRPEVLHALMRAHALATLVTSGPEGLEANHLPFELDAEQGLLRAHVARANPVWRMPEGGVEALAVFQGPSAYVSPSLYATKQEHGRVVPTWNYMVVHAHGRLRAIDDPAHARALVARLTERHEAGRPAPWKLEDAPADYLEKLLGQIVGIELRISRLSGKWKVSQNQPAANRASVEQGLREEGGAAAAMADEMARRR